MRYLLRQSWVLSVVWWRVWLVFYFIILQGSSAFFVAESVAHPPRRCWDRDSPGLSSRRRVFTLTRCCPPATDFPCGFTGWAQRRKAPSNILFHQGRAQGPHPFWLEANTIQAAIAAVFPPQLFGFEGTNRLGNPVCRTQDGFPPQGLLSYPLLSALPSTPVSFHFTSGCSFPSHFLILRDRGPNSDLVSKR